MVETSTPSNGGGIYFRIGDFSKITRLSVKVLRNYHELGLLVPEHVDERTGYRSYGPGSLERAKIIAALRELELPLKTIGEMLEGEADDDLELVSFLERHRAKIANEVERFTSIRNQIDAILATARQDREAATDEAPQLTEIPDMLYAGVRMTGRYEEIRESFKRVGRAAGFKIGGPPVGLFYDDAYVEEGADFEGGFPLKAPIDRDGIEVRQLRGGPALTVLHHGPYASIHSAYARLLTEAATRGFQALRPTREVYLKGPGMVFKGDPSRYQTRIEVLVESAEVG